MKFNKKLEKIQKKNNSLLCVGLDVDDKKIPSSLRSSSDSPFLDFNRVIIKQTKDIVCAYKLNLAFYEALGKIGYDLLEETITLIPKDIIVIVDGKRNDIGNTAKKYAQACFDILHADAITVNPYLGWDGIKPFLEYKDKCSFILCRTSNPSSSDFQNHICDGAPLYVHVAKKIKEWNQIGQCGVVVGATYPNELKTIRGLLDDDIPFLLPGIGKQGGNVGNAVRYGTNQEGYGAIINASRSIIYAGLDEHFSKEIRKAALALYQTINSFR
jgi:orotidine-5'-phosphate decarboxylase